MKLQWKSHWLIVHNWIDFTTKTIQMNNYTIQTTTDWSVSL